MINLSSLRLNDSIQFLETSSIRIGLKFVLLDLSSEISENLLFFFVFQGESWFFRFPCRDFISVSETNKVRTRVSPYLCVRKRTELTTNFLHESDKLVSSSLVLLAPEWTVMKIALFRWSHRRVRHHTSTKAPYLCRRIHPGRSLEKSLSSGSHRGSWAHNLWEDGFSPWSNTPLCAWVQWF